MICAPAAHAQTDTTATDTTEHKIKKIDSASRQLCIGFDLFHPVVNYFAGSRSGFEIAIDYYTRNEFYLALEGGAGSSTVDYSNLKYTTTNNFIRFGFDKSVLARNSLRDWDMMFIGMRIAASRISRGTATYTVLDSVWGNYPGTFPRGKPFPAIWAELNAGMRVELARNFFMGWTIRGKFMLNGKSFRNLSPLYIEGYGKGDKNAVFDFNVYASYTLRWRRKFGQKAEATVKPK